MRLKTAASMLGASICLAVVSWYGGFAMGRRTAHTAEQWLSFRKLAEVAELESFVQDAYKNENPEIGIWALNHLVEYLEDEVRLGALMPPFISASGRRMDLALARVRLSLRLREVGRVTEASACLVKAVEYLRGTGRDKVTPEQLVSMVERLDKRRSERTSGADPRTSGDTP